MDNSYVATNDLRQPHATCPPMDSLRALRLSSGPDFAHLLNNCSCSAEYDVDCAKRAQNDYVLGISTLTIRIFRCRCQSRAVEPTGRFGRPNPPNQRNWQR